jgi:hypothetical protein
MLPFDRDRVLTNVRQAETEDLLDRATVYRHGMEPEAMDLIDAELRARGVTEEQIQEHADRRKGRQVTAPDEMPARCSLCERAAVTQRWGWHRLWGLVPIFPRLYSYCEQHERT